MAKKEPDYSLQDEAYLDKYIRKLSDEMIIRPNKVIKVPGLK